MIAIFYKPPELSETSIGTISSEKAQEMLDNLESKKFDKIEKRKKRYFLGNIIVEYFYNQFFQLSKKYR